MGWGFFFIRHSLIPAIPSVRVSNTTYEAMTPMFFTTELKVWGFLFFNANFANILIMPPKLKYANPVGSS